ncbi:Ig-like domain-containing protein [Streptomyces sp. NPDC058001]|uniref:Ig-like domain-containing protein n=1 Tax=Streptomyces sp. NPDC058001 TaxID=3346300 RepID=UPI0036EE376E
MKLADGALRKVTVTDADGGRLAGKVSADKRTWTSERVSAPGTAYTVRATAARGGTAKGSFTKARRRQGQQADARARHRPPRQRFVRLRREEGRAQPPPAEGGRAPTTPVSPPPGDLQGPPHGVFVDIPTQTPHTEPRCRSHPSEPPAGRTPFPSCSTASSACPRRPRHPLCSGFRSADC